MHSMHQHESMQQMQQQQQQTITSIESDQDPIANISVFESLEPARQQQVGGLNLLDQQQQHLPHLHQMQPSRTNIESPVIMQPQQQQQQLDDQHQKLQSHSSGGRPNSLRPQRSNQIVEGIVADGGGPIVQWLLDNYEIADGESLPRSTVYNHYLSHCRQLQMASVNAASFGKLIRSVFIGLKTRRLGTRGHSKYHYFGIRAKQHIRQELMHHHHHHHHQQQQQQQSFAGCSRDQQQIHNMNMSSSSNQNTDVGSESDSPAECGGRLSRGSGSGKRVKRSQAGSFDLLESKHQSLELSHQFEQQQQQQHQAQQQQQQQQQQHQQSHEQQSDDLGSNGIYYDDNNPAQTNGFGGINGISGNKNNSGETEQVPTEMSMGANLCDPQDYKNHLGANWATLVDEHWPPREACDLERQIVKTTGVNQLADSLQLFEVKYKLYYRRMVELLSELKLEEIETLWIEFWHPTGEEQQVETQQWSSSEQSAPTSQSVSNSNNGGDDVVIQDNMISQRENNGQQQSTTAASDIIQRQLDYQPDQQLIAPQPQLPFNDLYQLTSQSFVVERINHIDYQLYAAIESFLLPDMLSPIPSALAQRIRFFARNIGNWIESSVKDLEPQFASEKSKSARAFGFALRRYLSLNLLSTASRAIWEKRTSLAQMSMDLSRVDLRDIEQQVSLMSHNISGIKNNTSEISNLPTDDSATQGSNDSSVSATNSVAKITLTTTTTNVANNNTNNENSSNNLVGPQHLCTMQPGQLIQNFLHLLEDPYPANSWPDWCRNLVESRVCGLSIEEARNFVLKWNFYISLVMKELTLRRAPSFGSFQLIRLLFDEYIFYLVVTRLAQAQHTTPAQLLSL